ncbi:hypothetical protein CU097_011928 [Rhizopus azygosporus]|uniref:Vacuolar protein sorting-associated protein vta1 n=1 Tax=Rhizopus azygosporus TaxID=86630 RepID=A0A367JJQ2_RHIAZ|nr:hypothetical protein CU097_011928 [Rhizopus azygosporus]
MEIPPELKYITPYIQRGQELLSREPVVAYYAQYYAAKLAISRGPRTKETNEYLSHLLESLETQKKSLGDNEAVTNDLVGYAHIENFALKIFLNADNEDRAGKASKKTAKTFLAASVFLELLKTFGDIDSEVEAKIKYAKWKATDIMKALREGRQPTAGPPIDESEQQEQVPSISEFPSPPSNFTAPLPSANSQLPDVPTAPAAPVVPAVTAPPPVPAAAPAPAPIPSSLPVQSPVSTMTVAEVSSVDISHAQKCAKWAISALNFEDIITARQMFLDALNAIGFNEKNDFGNK